MPPQRLVPAPASPDGAAAASPGSSKKGFEKNEHACIVERVSFHEPAVVTSLDKRYFMIFEMD